MYPLGQRTQRYAVIKYTHFVFLQALVVEPDIVAGIMQVPYSVRGLLMLT